MGSKTIDKQLQKLRDFALEFPEAEEGISCEGTAVETRTVKAGNKAFVFLGAKQTRLKLSKSLAQAGKLETKEPKRYKVGANGWVTVTYDSENPVDVELLQKWITESFQLLAPKRLINEGSER